jgi:hypothetical protein
MKGIIMNNINVDLTESESNEIYLSMLKPIVESLRLGKGICSDNHDTYLKINKDFEEKISSFTFAKLFTFGTDIGEFIEEEIVEKFFTDFKRVKNQNYDGIIIEDSNHLKIEVKAVRAVEKKEKSNEKTYFQRALSFDNNETITMSNTTFQQVKPQEFDYLLGFLIYKDKIELFLIKSDEINKNVTRKNEKGEGLIEISPQHKGNNSEGQININNLRKLGKNIGFFQIENGLFTYNSRDSKYKNITTMKISDLINEEPKEFNVGLFSF